MIEKPYEMQNAWLDFINTVKHELVKAFASYLVKAFFTGGSLIPFGTGGILPGSIIPAANGLLVNRPTLALLGERKESNPELVIPKRIMTEWLEETFGALNQNFVIVMDGEKVGKLVKKHELDYERLTKHVSP